MEDIILIGRDSNCNIVLTDGAVSRKHAKITITEDNMCIIEDCGSKNGTFVNGVRLTGPLKLRANDVVQISNITTNWQDAVYTIISQRQVDNHDDTPEPKAKTDNKSKWYKGLLSGLTLKSWRWAIGIWIAVFAISTLGIWINYKVKRAKWEKEVAQIEAKQEAKQAETQKYKEQVELLKQKLNKVEQIVRQE